MFGASVCGSERAARSWAVEGAGASCSSRLRIQLTAASPVARLLHAAQKNNLKNKELGRFCGRLTPEVTMRHVWIEFDQPKFRSKISKKKKKCPCWTPSCVCEFLLCSGGSSSCFFSFNRSVDRNDSHSGTRLAVELRRPTTVHKSSKTGWSCAACAPKLRPNNPAAFVSSPSSCSNAL